MPATPDLIDAYKAWGDKAPDYEQADAFAVAQVDEDFANAHIMRVFNKARVSTIEGFAYSAVPIRVISSRLALLPPTVTRIGSDAPHEAAVAALDRLWEDNELAAELKAALHRASKHGDAYILVWPVTEQTADDDPGDNNTPDDDQQQDEIRDGHEARPPAGRIIGVEILVNDARSVLAVYDEESPLRIKYVIKTWIDSRTNATRVNLYYPSHVEKWVCRKGARTKNPDSWERVPGAEKDVPTPHGRIPWFHLRNDRPYGTPEHVGAYGPQRLINKIVSSLSAVIDYQVGPQRYYMADPAVDDPHQNLTDPDWPDDDDDDPEEGGGESALSSDPGTVWKLYGKSAGQFEPADPDKLIKPLERAIRCMAELTGIPAFHFGWGTGDTPTGAALRTLDAPTGAIVDDRKGAYGPVFARALEYALALLGITDVRVQIRWKPTTVITDLEGWQIVAAKIANGVPVEQALIEAGYLPEQVAEWIADTDGADLTRRIALLQAAAMVVQTLTSATAGAPSSTPPAADEDAADDTTPRPAAPAPAAIAQPPTGDSPAAGATEHILEALTQILAALPAGASGEADAT